jgi:hypothetical protein
MASLADIRARLEAQENKQNNSGDSLTYPHWNIDDGSTAIVRFLPDGNDTNPYFWIERNMIKLPFAGIEGDPSKKEVIVPVPCMEMYGPNEHCPILTEVRPWFKDASLEDMGRKYWKKRSYIFQGFVHQDPMGEDTPPENPIRKFMISPQIFKIVKSSLMDPELEELPTDYTRGLDFRINKVPDGTFSDYSSSNWSRKETAITESELSDIENYGLPDLSTYLPAKPSAVELKAIFEMFEASVDGQAYDIDRWAQYYRPRGVDKPTESQQSFGNSPAPETKAAPEVNVSANTDDVAKSVAAELDATDDVPFDTTPQQKEKPGSNTADILAQIRARQNG